MLDPVSVVQEPMLLLALDAEQRTGPRGPEVRVRVASAIEPEWLLELFPERLTDEDRLVFSDDRAGWSGSPGWPTARSPSRSAGSPPSRRRRSRGCSREALRARGLGSAVDTGRLEALRARLELARTLFPEQHWPELDDAGLASVLARGRRSLAEVREADPAAELLGALSPESARLLARELPERVTLPGGRSVQVQYVSGQPPWIASRLQDFFGLREGPALARGRVPLVLHLLAPNQRAVQVTRTSPASGADTTPPSAASWGAATPAMPGRRTRCTPRPRRRGADEQRRRDARSRNWRPSARGVTCPPGCTRTPR